MDVLVGIVADHNLQKFLLEASVEVGGGVDLTVEADQLEQMFWRVVESEVVQLLEVGLTRLQYLHLDVDQIAEVHLLAHDVEDVVGNREVVVGLLVLHSPIRRHLRNLLRRPCSFLSAGHLRFELHTHGFELFEVVDDVHVC